VHPAKGTAQTCLQAEGSQRTHHGMYKNIEARQGLTVFTCPLTRAQIGEASLQATCSMQIPIAISIAGFMQTVSQASRFIIIVTHYLTLITSDTCSALSVHIGISKGVTGPGYSSLP